MTSTVRFIPLEKKRIAGIEVLVVAFIFRSNSQQYPVPGLPPIYTDVYNCTLTSAVITHNTPRPYPKLRLLTGSLPLKPHSGCLGWFFVSIWSWILRHFQSENIVA
jgi:hypothetical protein